MKKTQKTRLTALMFAAAGVGCMATVCNGDILYRVPVETAGPTTTTTTTEAANAAAYRALIDGMQLHVSARGELMGDVDGNGMIEVIDAAALQRYLHGQKSTINPALADLDGDGEIDIFDLGLLKRAVIEMRDQPPAPLYGPPEWFTTTSTTPLPTQPLYGPPEWFTTTATETMPTTFQTLYGPPEWFNTTVETITTTIPQDVYGPPNWFTSTTKPEDPQPTAETTVTTPMETTTMMETLYGPPNWFK